MGFIYKNPSDRIDWFGRFTLMLDTVCLEAKEVVLLGDSISIFWGQILDGMSSIKNVNLHQLIDKPTQITTYSETLTDHNFVTTEQNIAEVSSPVCGCSDHFPICVKWFYIYIKFLKPHIRKYSCCCCLPWSILNYHKYTSIQTPMKLLNFGTKRLVYDKHAPFMTKRVKYTIKSYACQSR